ncbi:SMC5-SMC6 complex localization factor protein 1 [Dromiciops gliroides]|uniref:SMC5-SMC6 complex localization factor protein 1 n=1 Tax=Dromiciops gliroides TaxID=33562 RepID=UPI001CC46212|nr:SMC5-SMC6 complex localization factor protein 1 [Dromiciops gliroides]XP_043830017.1 SMC5-SMC6 complex localization factor protein 1 [Dromiciops gliroides]
MEDSTQKHIVQLTGFRDKEKEDLTKLLLKLDCIFIKSKQYRNCTHLIAKRACKSEKYLAACAAGKWVLTKDYIINSAESGRWLDETTYEWGYKIEKDSHYSPQMQSAPKRWRKELTSTGAPGAFHRWKVVLLLKEGSKGRDSLTRILNAGKAQVFLPNNSPSGITHVISSDTNLSTEKAKYTFEGPYYPVQYLVDFLFLEKESQNDGDVQRNSLLTQHAKQEPTDRELADLKKALRKHICRVEAMKYNYMELTKSTGCRIEVKNIELPRNVCNIIENLIEGQFFPEALEELVVLQPHYIPPVCLLHALLRNMLEGNIKTLTDRYFHVLSVLLHLHPPWKSPAMLNYYLEFFQCPNCMKGAWSFLEVLIRSCLFSESFCHPVPDGVVSKMLKMALLTFFLKLVKSEVQHLSHKLYEGADSQSLKVPEQAFLLETFWSGNETSVFFTKPLNMLLDWTIYSQKQKFRSNDAFKNKMAYLLIEILGAVIEYWIYLGLKRDRKVMQHMSDQLGNYVAVSCDDFSSQELESFISSLSSSWLQMFIAESIFKKLCLQSCISISPGPLTLQKMVCAYLPALGKFAMLNSRKGQKRKKIGHWLGPDSQRALKTLSHGNQNQGKVLPEALELNHSLSLKRSQKKWEGELSCSKGNCHSSLPKMRFHKTNLRGETALHRACINNQVEKLILLLSLPGTDINVKDYAGWTPLHEACNHGNTVCVQEILQRCPEVDLLTQVDGVTPLHDALSNGHVEIGKLLLQHGGSVLLQQRTSKGKLPLDYVLTPQIKEDLLAALQVKGSSRGLHVQAEEHFYQEQIEFGSFLLGRMLLNFCSIFDLFSSFSLFKELIHLRERLFTSPRTCKDATSLHTDWIMDLYARDLVTLKKLPSLLKEIPQNLEVFPGVQTQALLMALKTMLDQSETLHDTS